MKLKLKAYSPQVNSNISFVDGTMCLKDNILTEFIENTENIHLLKVKYGEHLFPIKANTYTVNFLNEINEHHESFKATIRIKDSLVFYVKLNCIQKQKLEWMLRHKWIQQSGNLWKFIVFTITTIIAIISSIYLM